MTRAAGGRATPALLAACLATLVACRDTNITTPAPGDPAAGVIVFASDRADANSELYVMAADGGGLRRLTTSRTINDRAPALSRDGTRIVWERELTTATGEVTEVELWSMRADGSDARAVVGNGSFNRSPAWGPDGSIVFTSRLSGSDQVWRLAAGATTPVRLTTGDAADQHPRVSPDGSRIVFQSNRGLDFDVYVMAIDGSGVTNLTAAPGDDRFPTWTADGAQVVWTRFDDATQSFDLWIARAAGTGAAGEARALVATPFNELLPSVSPDGRHVVFQSDRVPPARLFRAPIEGGDATALDLSTTRTGSDQAPWWGPSTSR